MKNDVKIWRKAGLCVDPLTLRVLAGASGEAVSATASRSWTQFSKVRFPTFQSVIPQPRSSNRTKRKWPARKRIQWRQTGLSQSYSRWVSQFAALTSTGPWPASAHASCTPSPVRR
jgi:hypothetical protein